jgi:hypothetical protein
MAFFERKSKKSTSVRRRSLLAACLQCGCNNDSINDCRIPVSGKGNKKILLIRGQPTEYIDVTGD